MTSLSPHSSKLRTAGLLQNLEAERSLEWLCFVSPSGVFNSGDLHLDDIAAETVCSTAHVCCRSNVKMRSPMVNWSPLDSRTRARCTVPLTFTGLF